MSESNIEQLLLDVQKELQEVSKNANNPHFRSKYANFNAVLAEVKEKLNSRNILIEQTPGADEYGKYVQTALKLVGTEQSKACKVYLELPKPDMQKMGSAITYAKRYGLQTLMVLPSEDDDGNSASEVGSTTTANTPSKSGGFGSKTNNSPPAKSFGGAKKAPAKKVTPKKVETPAKEPVAAKAKIPTKKVTPPPTSAPANVTSSNKAFSSNKPSFSSRVNKSEPEF